MPAYLFSLMCRDLIGPPSVRGLIKAFEEIGKGRYRRHVNDRFPNRRTGKTLLTAIRDGEVEHRGLTPLTVPGLCGENCKIARAAWSGSDSYRTAMTPR